MLALPDLDVLDALGCDVVTICDNVTNAFDQPDTWHPYDFDGRLPALVRNPAAFPYRTRRHHPAGCTRACRPRRSSSTTLHGGQPVNLDDDLPK